MFDKDIDFLPNLEHEECFGKHNIIFNTGSFCFISSTNTFHYHKNYYELCLVISGKGLYIHNDKKYKLMAGDIFIADPLVIQEISSHETKNLYLVYFRFSINF